MNMEQALQFTLDNKWDFAKTMRWVPHFYVVKDTCTDKDAFVELVEFIREEGVDMKWGKMPPKPYLDMGDWRYWTMPAPAETVGVINRELIRGSKAEAV